MVFNLSDQNSVGNHFVAEMRDSVMQVDRMKFRCNMERLGEIMAYEISKKLPYKPVQISTPLGVKATSLLVEQPVLIAVLRAGVPYFQGFVNFFDRADCGFIGAYRQEGTDAVRINLEYAAAPSIEGRRVILIDPMLATGNSFIRSIEAITKNARPAHIFIASLVATRQGIQFVEENVQYPYSVWTCSIDDTLNDQFYIVPGLGDAGDLSFGEKI